jgi:hypothetical protein
MEVDVGFGFLPLSSTDGDLNNFYVGNFVSSRAGLYPFAKQKNFWPFAFSL